MISTEARAQLLAEHGGLPDWVVAAVGGGSNAIGAFADFIADESVALLGVEAAGEGIASGRRAATITAGHPGVRQITSVAAPIIAERSRQIDSQLPVGIGLGVGTGDQAAQVAGYADAVIVVSARVRCLDSDGADLPADLRRLSALVAELAAEVRRG